MWQAPRQHCCRCACQIPKRFDDLNYLISRLRDFMRSYDKTSYRILKQGLGRGHMWWTPLLGTRLADSWSINCHFVYPEMLVIVPKIPISYSTWCYVSGIFISTTTWPQDCSVCCHYNIQWVFGPVCLKSRPMFMHDNGLTFTTKFMINCCRCAADAMAGICTGPSATTRPGWPNLVRFKYDQTYGS